MSALTNSSTSVHKENRLTDGELERRDLAIPWRVCSPAGEPGGKGASRTHTLCGAVAVTEMVIQPDHLYGIVKRGSSI